MPPWRGRCASTCLFGAVDFVLNAAQFAVDTAQVVRGTRPHPSDPESSKAALLNILNGQERAGLLQQCLLDLQVFGVNCVCAASASWRALKNTSERHGNEPWLVVLATVAARNLLPGAHQLTVRAGGLRPIGRGGQLLGASNQLFLRALDRALRSSSWESVAVAVEGGAGGAKRFTAHPLHALGRVNLTLSLHASNIVHAGMRVLPVNLVGSWPAICSASATISSRTARAHVRGSRCGPAAASRQVRRSAQRGARRFCRPE